jgi:hypothetical protein
MSDTLSKDEWLAVREVEAKLIDPRTAEVIQTRGDLSDPYGLDPSQAEGCAGDIYFARRPNSDVWVELGHLPPAVYTAVWNRFLAGQADFSPMSFRSPYTLAEALRRAAAAHEKEGQHHHDGDWASWYAEYIAREQAEWPGF